MAEIQPLVLLTGATGFVGFHTLIDLLKSCYRVRAIIRSDTKIDEIREHKLVKALGLSPDTLSFVVVSDFVAPGAFDSAVQGVTYIIHIAAPVPSFTAKPTVEKEDYEKYFVQDSIDGTLGLFQSATAAGSQVKRIVLTSSAVSVIPFPYFAASPDADYSIQFGPGTRQTVPSGPFDSEIVAYSAGKTATLNAAEQWIAENKANINFDLVPTLSGWAFGRDELVTSAKDLQTSGTNSVLVGLILGNKSDWPFNGNAVLVTDIARIQVLALNTEKISGNRAFVTSIPIVWDDAVEVIRDEFAAEVEEGHLSVDGKQPTQPIDFDGSNTEKIFGIMVTPFKEVVKQVANQYVELLGPA
ncbi:uncharacterized protein N7483_002031 [Penicillium malachiteum]|uniref:uncharacterized protein n=1 Tax=Penicillium malachiteum TaxID=1324776 RepID=UPI0025485537|nr:uncharacterized protein N7483_002031 [Penicillium malachiteum]KAJ5736906.1 hypothetical protein N7483_002031 [Penicillium malachiteum]